MAGEYLWVTEGNAEGTTVALDDEFVVGRSESGEGRLGDDPEISRAHARFYREGGQLMVADLGSTNGTLVNGTRISAPQPLQPGDQVRTGKTTMQVVAPEGAEPAAAEATVLDQAAPVPPPPPAPAYEQPPQQPAPAAFQAPTQPHEPAAAPGQGRRGWVAPVLAGLGALLLIGGIVAVLLLAGGDDEGGGDELDGPAAEETVKDYLRAFVDGDGDGACDQLTDDYSEEIVERNEAFVDEDVSECPELIEALEEELSQGGGLTFEGEDLSEDFIDDLDLKSDVERGSEGDGESATVEGPKDQQRFELEPVDGEWKISNIEST